MEEVGIKALKNHLSRYVRAAAGGRTVLEAPSEPVAIERIPWAFAPRDARPLPATAATAWLTPLLPTSPSTERR